MTAREISRVYHRRFADSADHRQKVWEILTREYFQRLVRESDVIMDLGCGYGEFINRIRAREKYGMDLNADAGGFLSDEVRFLRQDCVQPWPVADDFLDVVFTSNFFEHLPDKNALVTVLGEARRCLKPGGRLIALGPNIRHLGGAYWSFWDHHLPLSAESLSEGLTVHGFTIERCIDRFLPYTMVGHGKTGMIPGLKLYLRFPVLWRLLGKQFLIVARCDRPPA